MLHATGQRRRWVVVLSSLTIPAAKAITAAVLPSSKELPVGKQSDHAIIVQMENVVGNRHKLHPCIKHERYRGSSQIKFSDGDPDSSRPWKTTNQVEFLGIVL